MFRPEAGFDWTSMGDGRLSRDPGSVLAAGLLFGKTFNEPQLCELSGLWTIGVGLVSRLGGARKEGQNSEHEEHEEHNDDEQLKHENKPRLLVAAVIRGGGAGPRLVLIGGQSVKDGNIAMEMFKMFK